jgi:HD domain
MVPDTKLVKEATELMREVSPPFLQNHCWRTYRFAAAIAEKLGRQCDGELLYLASILHDLGLTERFDGVDRFEVVSADAARDFALQHGYNPQKADMLWDAIALHTTIGIALRKSAESALVCMGVTADVAGFNLELLDKRQIDTILAEYPRLGMNQALLQVMVQYIRTHPQVVPLTWMADIAKEYVPEVPCPSFMQIVQAGPFAE